MSRSSHNRSARARTFAAVNANRRRVTPENPEQALARSSDDIKVVMDLRHS